RWIPPTEFACRPACGEGRAPPWSAAMVRWLAAAALGALAIGVQGCGKGAGADASGAAQGLLAAAQAANAEAFEAWLDRPALRGVLREQMIAVAQQNGL